MTKLTVIIPTFNEEINIGDCIEGVRWADEILIVDSFSTDNTLEIVKKYDKTRIIQREYQYSTSQKNWAIPQAGNDWVLIVDADERVSQELAEEIQKVISSESDINMFAAYRIKRQNYFIGKRIRYSGWQNDSVIRLFRKDLAKYEDKFVHGKLIVDGKTRMLKSHFSHHTVYNLKEYFEKMTRYTTWAAQEKLKKGKKVNGLIIAARTILLFLRNYILRLGFLDGIHGFILCSLSAFSEFTKLCKLWELKIQESLQKDNLKSI